MDLLSVFSQLLKFLKEQVRNLVTIVSRALQPQDGMIRCPEDTDFTYNCLRIVYIDFCSFVDNVETIVSKICFLKEK